VITLSGNISQNVEISPTRNVEGNPSKKFLDPDLEVDNIDQFFFVHRYIKVKVDVYLYSASS